MTDWSRIDSDICAATGTAFHTSRFDPVSGGCIHEARRLQGNGTSYFVKSGHASAFDMFESEADGLSAITATAAISTPHVICAGHDDDESWLVLEWIDLDGDADAAAMGRNLATMHAHHGSYFGWHRDNWIGSSVQHNGACDDWARFWRDRRLAVQFDMAAANGHAGLAASRDELLGRVSELMEGHSPAPSLVHGDLWSGNAGYDRAGRPVIFDPAVYYGDAEVDLAMTELFGGFPNRFYEAYRETLPEMPGYRLRRDVYNLYHVLNHANLFGGDYLAQATALISKILR